MAKISVSIDDDLATELKESARGNVSAFVARAVRRQLDREQLDVFLGELQADLGPATDDEMAEAAAAFDRVARATRRPATTSATARASAKRAAPRRRPS